MADRKSLAERFWPKVDKGSHPDCWLWTGSKHEGGYGRIQISYDHATRTQVFGLAHRVARQLLGLPLTDDTHHTCPHKHCVNPDHNVPTDDVEHQKLYHPGHWEAVTYANVLKERTHCPHGHSLDGTYLSGTRKGMRYCRECRRQYLRARRKTDG